MVADAALATHEEHGDVPDGLDRHAVVPGAARQPPHAHAARLDRALELAHEPGRAGARAEVLQQFDVAVDVPLVGDLADSKPRQLHCALMSGIVGRSDINGEPNLARNDVDRTGLRLDAADRADKVFLADRDGLDSEYAFRRGGERIAAQTHGHGPGVAGFAAQRDAKAGEAVDRGHYAHRQAFGLEHRALLDVELGVGENVAFLTLDLGEVIRVEAELAQRACDRRAGGVLGLEYFGRKRAGDRAAAQQRGAEA